VHRRAHQLHHLGRRRRRPAQLVDAAVVRHPEQPRPQRELAVAGPQPGVGTHEHVLEGVLGILAQRQHLPGVGEQALVVALVDDAKRVVVTGSEEGYQLLVGAKSQQRDPNRNPAAAECCRRMNCGRFHSNPSVTLNERSAGK
jgi:hypothetical protein